MSDDAEAVVDLGVVAFAEQSGVLQGGLALVGDPLAEMVDVAPVAGGVAAGEDAGHVAVFDRPAEVGWGDPPGAAEVEGLAVGADDDAGDGAVAGQPAGAGGGDLGP